MVRVMVARIPPDLVAVALQQVRLVAEHVDPQREPMCVVGVTSDEAQRALLAAAADEDWRSAGLDRTRPVERLRRSGSTGPRRSAAPR